MKRRFPGISRYIVGSGSTLGLALTLVFALASGCREQPRPDGAAMSDSEAVAAAARRDPAENEAESAGPGGHGSQGSARIYYDLTEFGWYRRGEPLVHAGSPYEPGARPRVIRPPALRPEGEYQGVEFYVLRNGPTRPDTVYVPVFRNYWQPFVRLTRPPAPAQD